MAVMLYLSLSPDIIEERMSKLPVLSMRLELKEAINKCSVINDSYTADWSSLQLALNFLNQQQQHSKKSLILSDIFQSGKSPEALYSDIAQLLKQHGIQRFIGIGPTISAHAHLFEAVVPETFFYPATDVFLEQFHPSMFRDETILIKGARSFEFERIVTITRTKNSPDPAGDQS